MLLAEPPDQMPSLSDLKSSVISALRNPHEATRQRSNRRVVPFDEALQNLKTPGTGFVTCAAFGTFGKCRKEIALTNPKFLSSLNELNMTDVQTPIKLMPFLLCSSHWEKTIYYNALFLDWLFVYGSRHDNQYFENIVIDYQSAVTIDNNETHMSHMPIPLETETDSERRSDSAPYRPIRGM